MNRGVTALLGAGIGYSVYLLVTALRAKRQPARPPSASFGALARVDMKGLAARWQRLLLAGAAGIAAAAVTGWPVLLAVVPAAVWWLPSVLGPDRETQNWVDRAEACASFAESLRDTLAAASGLQQAVTAVAAMPPEAIAGPAQNLSDDLRLGVPLPAALQRFQDVLADPISDRICCTLADAATSPARNLAPMLGILAQGAREEALNMRNAMAERARVRTGARVIVGVLTTVMVGLMAADAAFLDPFATALGQLDIAVACGMFAVGFIWLVRLTRPMKPRRFLTRCDRVVGTGGDV